jgi:hypothetical protein
MRPGLKTTAFERETPWPLLSKEPLTHTPLGMIPAKTGMSSVHPLEGVDEARRRQIRRREPTAQIPKRPTTLRMTTPMAASLTSMLPLFNGGGCLSFDAFESPGVGPLIFTYTRPSCGGGLNRTLRGPQSPGVIKMPAQVLRLLP